MSVRWQWFAVLLIPAVAGAAGFFVLQKPQPTNTQVVETVLSDLLNGKSESLYENLLPSERSGMSLSEERVRTVYTAIIWPELRASKREGSLQTDVDPITLTATSFQVVRGQGQLPGTFGLSAYITEEGPKVSMWDAVLQAWILRETFQKKRLLTGNEKRVAVLNGFHKDRAKLRGAGIDRIQRPVADAVPVTFDEYEKNLRKKIQQYATPVKKKSE